MKHTILSAIRSNSNFRLVGFTILLITYVFTEGAQSQINKNEYIDLNNKGDSISTKKGFDFIINYLDPCGDLDNYFAFDYGWNCKRFGDVCVFLQERVLCNGPLNLEAVYDPNNPVECFLGGNPKDGYLSPYSAGMIHQEEGLHRFGFFEASINTPSSRGLFPAFWLAGGGGGAAGYNEIDIMEHGVGDVVVHSDHYDDGTGNVSRGKWNYCLPSQSFSGNNVIYGVKWDKNKIVWYINNRPVKIITDIEGTSGIEENHPIVDVDMRIIANHQIEKSNVGYNDYLPKLDSSVMQIHYINYWARTDTFGTVDFTINDQKSNNINNPILIQQQESCTKVRLDLTNSYLPDHNFYLKLTSYNNSDLNDSLVFFNTWIKPPSNLINQPDCRNDTIAFENIYEFDLDEIVPCEYWTDTSVRTRITIGCLPSCCLIQCPNYIQTYGNFEENIFKLIPCIRKLEFKLNGNNTCSGTGQSIECLDTILEIGDNHGKSRIIMDVSGTQTCANDYFVSIEKSDSIGGRTYMEKIKWLSDSEKVFLPFIDIERVWKNPNIDNSNTYYLEAGSYYRVKLATGGGGTWHEKVQLIHITDCSIEAEFTLNGFSDDNDTIEISLGEPIILDATPSEFCSYGYTILVSDMSDSSSGTFADFKINDAFYFPANQIGPGKLQYKYHQGDLDLYDKVLKWDTFKLRCDKYYKVKLRIVDTIKSVTVIDSKIIHIAECSPNSAFQLYGDYCQNGYANSSPQNFKSGNNVHMWAPDFKSCNFEAVLTIRQITGAHPTKFILDTLKSQKEISILRESGDFSITDLINQHQDTFGTSPTQNGYSYRITLMSSDISSCHSPLQNSMTSINIFFDDDSCGLFQKLETRSNLNSGKNDSYKLELYPNPTNSGFYLKHEDYSKENATIEVFNLSGSKLYERKYKITSSSEYFDENIFSASGIYLLKINVKSEIIYKKIVIQK